MTTNSTNPMNPMNPRLPLRVCSGGDNVYDLAKSTWGALARPLVVGDVQPGERPVGRVAAHWSGPSFVVVAKDETGEEDSAEK